MNTKKNFQQKNNNEKVLQEIAKQFAIDYYSISNINPKDEHRDKVKNEIFKKEYHKELDISYPCNVRNIVVLGAGATYDAYKEIPLARDAVSNIKQKLGIDKLYKTPPFSNKIEELEKRMKQIYRINPKEFESELSLMSKYVPYGEIEDQLTRLYKKRLYPSLFYELLAHFFKHRSIDVIINFNFDELLDQAIEEELNADDYLHIFSDGQCMPFNDILHGGRMSLPVYIKPHGTISYKSSLKFTKEAYFGLSREMQQLLADIIKGKRGKESDHHIEKVNLIIVGTSLKSFEFNEIIKDNLPAKAAIYFFSNEEPDKEELIKQDPEFAKKFFDYYEQDGFKRFYRIESDINQHNQLGIAFQQLNRRMFRKEIFNPLYEPKDTYRHDIISEVFYNSEKGRRIFYADPNNESEVKEKDCRYMEARLYMEFIISLCKAKGKITLNELMQERFGYYYKLYYHAMSHTDNKLTINKILEYFGVSNSFSASEQRILLEAREVGLFLPNLLDRFKKLKEKKGYGCLDFLSNDKYREKMVRVKYWLKKIYIHDSLSISPKFNNNRFFTFPNATESNIITTKLRLVTSILGGNEPWDLLLISSNKGKILLNLLDAENERKKNQTLGLTDYSKRCCCIILEDDLYQKELEKLIGPDRLLDGKINKNDKHNDGDNIILFLKRQKDNKEEPWKFVKGIVYYRINESFKGFPYFVKDEEHNKILFREFNKDYCTSNNIPYIKGSSNKMLIQFAEMFDKKGF
jgi:SIR2-like domain